MVRRGKITSITEQGLQFFSEQYDFIKKQLEKQIKDCDYIIKFRPIGDTFSIVYKKDWEEKYHTITFEEFLKNQNI